MDVPVVAISIYRRHLQEGLGKLRFEPEVEQEFLEFRRGENCRQLRFTILTVALLVLLLTLFDLMFSSGSISDSVVLGWCAFGEASLLLLFLSTRPGNLRVWQENLGLWAGIAIGPGGIMLGLVMDFPQGFFQSPGFYVSATWLSYFCFGMRLRSAVIVAALCWALVIVVELVSHSAFHQLLFSILLLACANMLGASLLYSIELQCRSNFLYRRDAEYMANHDDETGLFNRKALMQHLQSVWTHCYREQLPLAVAMIDIDYFRRYNDLYGHDSGDRVLADIAQLLTAAARRPLDLVARFGGEEFTLVLPGCDQEQAMLLLQKLKQELHERELVHAGAPRGILTLSAGLVSTCPDHDLFPPMKLLELADEALSEAKENGRDRIISTTLQVDMLKRLRGRVNPAQLRRMA